MRLEMKEQAFWLDGTPHFFYGGEVHYFRIAAQQWRDRLWRLRDMGITTVSTYIPWIWHAPEQDDYDFDGRTHEQRNLLRFLDLSDNIGLSIFVRPGPYIMSELRHEGLPDWLLERYPEIIARAGHGEIHPTGMVSYLHPVFLEQVSRWYSALSIALNPYFCQNGGPIILTQIDNEVGMLHWVSGIADSHEAQKSHTAEYQDVLNAETYGDAPYWQEGVFWREYRTRYLSRLTAEARQDGFPGPYVINVHGFRDFSVYSRGVDYPIGLSQLAGAASIPGALLGGDLYPGHVTYDNFHDLALAVTYTRSVNRSDTAAISPEFQSGRFQDRPGIEPSDLDLAARISISYGLNGLNWYMLSGGENPDSIGLFGRRHDWQAPIGKDGELRQSAEVVSHLGSLFQSFGQQLAVSQPVIDMHIGYYSAYYMTENAWTDNAPEDRHIIEEIVSERESLHFDGIYRILVASNLTVGAVAIDKVEQALDPAALPFLWVASARYMDARTQLRLSQYVRAGGILILGPRLPEWDFQGRPCRILADTLDLPIPHYGERGLAQILNCDSVYCPVYATFAVKPGAEALGHLSGGHPPADAVVVRQSAGQGVVVLMGCGLPALYQYYHGVVRSLVYAIGCSPSLHVSNPAIHAAHREGPQGNFLFVHNFHEQAQDTCITLQASKSELGSLTWNLSIPGRQGMMLPFGKVALMGGRLAVLSTTNEISQRTGGAMIIYRTAAPGETLLQCTGTGIVVEVTSGKAQIETREDRIHIHWDIEVDSAPIVLSIGRTDSMTMSAPQEVPDSM